MHPVLKRDMEGHEVYEKVDFGSAHRMQRCNSQSLTLLESLMSIICMIEPNELIVFHSSTIVYKHCDGDCRRSPFVDLVQHPIHPQGRRTKDQG